MFQTKSSRKGVFCMIFRVQVVHILSPIIKAYYDLTVYTASYILLSITDMLKNHLIFKRYR